MYVNEQFDSSQGLRRVKLALQHSTLLVYMHLAAPVSNETMEQTTICYNIYFTGVNGGGLKQGPI